MRLFRPRMTLAEPAQDVARRYREIMYGGSVPPEVERDALLVEKAAMRGIWRWMATHPAEAHEGRKLALAREMTARAASYRAGARAAIPAPVLHPDAAAYVATWPGEGERFRREIEAFDIGIISRMVQAHKESPVRARPAAEIVAEYEGSHPNDELG